MVLTKRQHAVLEFISRFIEARGYAPSLEEIAEGVGCSSIATVHRHLTNLEAKGAIRRAANRSRSVEPVRGNGTGFDSPSGIVAVPLLGVVAAGAPIEAVEDAEPLALPESLVRGDRTFALRVQGDSMIDEHIRNGDIILVERAVTAENGQTVVALIDGVDVTVKRWYATANGSVRLEPANERMEALVLPAERVRIHGRVIGLLRKY